MLARFIFHCKSQPTSLPALPSFKDLNPTWHSVLYRLHKQITKHQGVEICRYQIYSCIELHIEVLNLSILL
jgi:hypothetical protein